MKIALLGYGRMGKTIEKIALQRGHTIVLKVDENTKEYDIKIADIAIDFSIPSVAFNNISNCLNNNIPVITFDSDLLEEDQQYRLAYVGTNNFDYGVALGNELKKFTNKTTNQVCIQSGHSTTPNLNKRIEGVRYALSGQKDKRLSGENGWSEFDRCPLYSLGKREVSLGQLDKLLNLENPPLFLAVAGFAQFNSNYANVIAKHKQRIANQEVVIVSADTEQMQLEVLQQGLSSANIGQNPFEMGRLSAELMYQYLTKGERPAKSHYYLDFHYCQQSNAGTCTVNH